MSLDNINLPTIKFSELNPVEIESAVLKTYEQISETTLYPGDPVRLFLESLAYLLTLQNNLIDMAGKQNLLEYAEFGHLDHLGNLMNTPRLGASSAQTKQRFTLVEPLLFAVSIPKGTRVTSADSKIVFATDELLTIEAGELEGFVAITANNRGVSGNGFVIGQINRIIDPIAYVKETENSSTTNKGADVESDNRYRERIRLAPEAYSNAGSYGAYRYHALRSHQDVFNVSVFSPIPGTVDIRLIGQGGELVSDEILDAVRKNVSADDVRPLTDTVIVQNPEIVPYMIHVKWSIEKSKNALSSSITAKVKAALKEYCLWQKSLVGRDINPTKLVSLLEQAGARRVEVIFPMYTVLKESEIARENTVIIEFLGIEQE